MFSILRFNWWLQKPHFCLLCKMFGWLCTGWGTGYRGSAEGSVVLDKSKTSVQSIGCHETDSFLQRRGSGQGEGGYLKTKIFGVGVTFIFEMPAVIRSTLKVLVPKSYWRLKKWKLWTASCAKSCKQTDKYKHLCSWAKHRKAHLYDPCRVCSNTNDSMILFAVAVKIMESNLFFQHTSAVLLSANPMAWSFGGLQLSFSTVHACYSSKAIDTISTVCSAGKKASIWPVTYLKMSGKDIHFMLHLILSTNVELLCGGGLN